MLKFLIPGQARKDFSEDPDRAEGAKTGSDVGGLGRQQWVHINRSNRGESSPVRVEDSHWSAESELVRIHHSSVHSPARQ